MQSGDNDCANSVVHQNLPRSQIVEPAVSPVEEGAGMKSQQTVRSAWLWGAAAALVGCGGPVAGTREVTKAPSGARAVAAEDVGKDLPAPPRGSLWGDGFGDTQHQAVLNAKRAVSEQIVSKVQGSIEAREKESTGRGPEVDVSQKVTSETSFDHAELIKIAGFARGDNGWSARAVLDKSEAADVYEKEIEADRERLAALEPVVTKAIEVDDASILLSAGHSPGHLIAEQRRKGQVLAVLGRAGNIAPPSSAIALEKKASIARKGAVLRLEVEGKASPELRRAVVDSVSRALKARGCRLVEVKHETAPDAGLAANVTLRVAVRNHSEDDLRWRYLGLEVVALDARSGKPIFRYSAMPELVHGGGTTWAQADAAVARRLDEKLPKKAGKRFDQITCR